jgi:hypothetical protein
MDSLTVGIRDGRVVLFNPGARLALAFSWRAAVDVGHAMAYKARGVIAADPEKVASVRVRREAGQVMLEDAVRGSLLVVLPLPAAIEIGYALIGQARRLETVEKHEAIVFDQALLARRGMPFGVTSNPRLQELAMQEAHWNSRLRRALPGGVRSEEAVGTPTIRRQVPDWGQANRRMT